MCFQRNRYIFSREKYIYFEILNIDYPYDGEQNIKKFGIPLINNKKLQVLMCI